MPVCLGQLCKKILVQGLKYTHSHAINFPILHITLCQHSFERNVALTRYYTTSQIKLAPRLPHEVVSMVGNIYLPTPVDFKTLPINLQNFLALEQHHRCYCSGKRMLHENFIGKYMGPAQQPSEPQKRPEIDRI